MRLSQDKQLNTLHGQVAQGVRRLRLPEKLLSFDVIIGRALKFVWHKQNLEDMGVLEPLIKDFNSFEVELLTAFKSKADCDSFLLNCRTVHFKKQKILDAPLAKDFLEELGFSFNKETFDDLHTRGWAKAQDYSDTESEEESPVVMSAEPQEQGKVEEELSDNVSEPDEQKFVEEEPEEEPASPQQIEEILTEMGGSKANWFKYIIEKHVLVDQSEENMLKTPDQVSSLLTIIRSSKSDNDIQSELIDLLGYGNMDMMEDLFKRRADIKEYCGKLIEKQKKEQESIRTLNYNPGTIGITVMQGKPKNRGKGRTVNTHNSYQQQLEYKDTNYDILRKIGFSDLIDQNIPLGLKPNKPMTTQQIMQEFQREQEEGFEDGTLSMINPGQKKAPDMMQGGKVATEDCDDWQSVTIFPPPKTGKDKSKWVQISSIPGFAQPSFGESGHLNAIQTEVYPVAFQNSQNLLVAAPTGAGKTNIALLCILKEISQLIPMDQQNVGPWSMKDKQFKIVYIAPLKALAAEIVSKFQKALEYLQVKVRELTGDMSMTKLEIQETHIIVSTPEKWDVVTRKTDGLMNTVTCMIIDEIHLLNDERGLVLECLVARAVTTGNKNQKPVRLVGLSATLPNYKDVGNFIQCSSKGVFAFDASYRPTPLKCSFYGIKSMGNAERGNNIMNDIIFENVTRMLAMGKQVIIFAHKRAETYNTAMELKEIIQKNGDKFKHLFDCEKSYTQKKKVVASRNLQIKELFDFGFSTHHAGMLRKDRNLVEDLFRNGHIKVLCSTSTLAWGVNLPAYGVIIKGTKVYDSSQGAFKDIGVFDVQQIFGRAGRPQYDTEGEAIILTEHQKMDEYVKMMQNKQTIESNLDRGLSEAINAEISAGTITTIDEGIQWMKKTYYYQRVIKCPINYGFKATDLEDDPSGHGLLLNKIQSCVENLNRMRLIRYNQNTDAVYSTDMGRVASNYYINCETMGYFMGNLLPHTRSEMILYHMAQAAEFKQLDARKEEYEELKQLVTEVQIVEVDKGSFNTAYTKVLILFECYLRRRVLKTFSLISDMAYVVQNGARLLRAIFEIAMQKNYSELATLTLQWGQLLEKRMLPNQHILRQFTRECSVGKLTNPNSKVINYGYINEMSVIYLEEHRVDCDDIFNRNYKGVDRVIAPIQMDEIKKFTQTLPYLDLDVALQPITRTILKVALTITAEFNWNDRWSGRQEPFWIFVNNETEILHQEYFPLQKKDVRKPGQKRGYTKNDDSVTLVFFIPYQVEEGATHISSEEKYYISIHSDRWYGLSFFETIELGDLTVPDEDYPNTKLLPLRPMPISALGDPKFEALYKQKFRFYNPIQTQVFHTLFHTDSNVLIGAPTGSGKTNIAEMAILRVFKNQPQKKCIYIAPLKALAKERIIDWKCRMGSENLKKSVVELTGDFTPDLKALKEADLLITTPEKWDGISRNWQHRSYVSDVALVIIDEIHLLGQDRGPVIEVIVSRMRYIAEQTKSSVRFVGLSTALANAKDVADWMGIHKLGLFNFKPSVRPVPIKVFFDGFPEKAYCPRMATMNRPAFKAINTHSRDNPVLVFVSSRRQTRLTALDLIAMSAADQQEKAATGEWSDFKKPFLHMDPEEISALSEYIRDENLRQTIQYGVGMHHAGLEESDRKIVEDLFVKKKIQILVTTSTLAWGVNFPARLVIVKGTEFFDPELKRYVDFPLTDLLQMIGRAGRPGFDDSGIACVFVQEEKKNFYKKFLYEPFPVESSLATQLTDHLNAEISSGTLTSRQNCIDYLTWTYFFRRLTKNPAFYNLTGGNTAEGINKYLNDLITGNLMKLKDAGCIELEADSDKIIPTQQGYIASFYYLSHETVSHLDKMIGADTGIEELIDILSNCQEFKGLPVRHNEEILNEALSHLVPLKVSKHLMESPFTKTNLLLQAHFDRCPLPITDFVTDAKSVLDQSIRVIQGMIDISAHKGHLQTTLKLVNLLQMLIQGQWLDQSPFLNVPHFTNQIILNLQSLGITHIVQLATLGTDRLKDLLTKEIKTGFGEFELTEIIKALQKVPVIQLKWSAVAVDEFNAPQEGQPLEEGGEAQLVVNVHRVNKGNSQHVAISNYPKFKECSWFLIVANPTTNEIIVLKRLNFKRTTSKNLIIALPKDFSEPNFELHLVCDSYIGLDQVYEIDFGTINEKITGVKKQPKKVQQAEEVQEEQHYSLFGGEAPAIPNDSGYENYQSMSLFGEQQKDEEHDVDDSFEYDHKMEDLVDMDIVDLPRF